MRYVDFRALTSMPFCLTGRTFVRKEDGDFSTSSPIASVRVLILGGGRRHDADGVSTTLRIDGILTERADAPPQLK